MIHPNEESFIDVSKRTSAISLLSLTIVQIVVLSIVFPHASLIFYSFLGLLCMLCVLTVALLSFRRIRWVNDALLESAWLVAFLSTVPASAVLGCFDQNGTNIFYTGHFMHLMIIAILLPVPLGIIVKSIDFKVVLVGWFFIVSTFGAMIICNKMWNAFEYFGFVVVVSFVALYERHRKLVYIHSLEQQLLSVLQEKRCMASSCQQETELRHMMGNVAHDLKTPLAAFTSGVDLTIQLCGELQVFAAKLSPTPQLNELNERIAAIRCRAEEMRTINAFMLMTINRCIDYTKSTSGLKLVPRMETINLQEALLMPVNCVRAMMSDKFTLKLLRLPFCLAPYVITDGQWLQENVLCLLSNAIKYSNDGMITVKVTIVGRNDASQLALTLAPESGRSKHNQQQQQQLEPPSQLAVQDYIRVEVEDAGIGLPPEKMGLLFKPFKQAQRMAGGTGLGLFSLARRIEALEGRCGVRPRDDGAHGSLFWFEIPYVPDTVSSSADKESAGSGNNGECTVPTTALHLLSASVTSSKKEQPCVKPLNILLVDDAASIQKMMGTLLRKQGHSITCAENGAIALRMLTEERHLQQFDVVLMDFQMPVMDGLEATQRIREWEKANSSGAQLIIGSSANIDQETMNEGFKAGINAFLPKPFNIAAFNDSLLACKGKQQDQ